MGKRIAQFGKSGILGSFWRLLPWAIGIALTLALWQFIRHRRPNLHSEEASLQVPIQSPRL